MGMTVPGSLIRRHVRGIRERCRHSCGRARSYRDEACASSSPGEERRRGSAAGDGLHTKERPGAGQYIGGSVCISGPTVQARDVQGGIHFHHTGPSRPPIPRQLPPVSAHFVGREDELTALDSCRAAHPEKSPLLMVISGPAGIGKTALASRWVDGLAAEFPDGQLYADLGGYSPSAPLSSGEVLERFLRALGAANVPAQTVERSCDVPSRRTCAWPLCWTTRSPQIRCALWSPVVRQA
ncbi:AAA family ATPase [Streptomyces antimycoticus]|uniref:AAA family ATPase n=1 Tax=Streptomyces antimycoticus TaxID=68175 RepID=UPI003530A9CD